MSSQQPGQPPDAKAPESRGSARRQHTRAAALALALATSVAAFGAFVLPRASDDAAGGESSAFAIVVSTDTASRSDGCDRYDDELAATSKQT